MSCIPGDNLNLARLGTVNAWITNHIDSFLSEHPSRYAVESMQVGDVEDAVGADGSITQPPR